MTLPVLPNALARKLFLDRHALADAPTGAATGAALAALVQRIGFVQIDSIATVERAHHMILFSRRQSYRPEALEPLLERDRQLWEHWTHDASALPVETFPHWRHRFARSSETLRASWQRWFPDGYEALFDGILDHIARHGPVAASHLGRNEARRSGGWWDWHPSKAALEWLWWTGRVAVTRRDGFQKVYDLTERVVPANQYRAQSTFEQTLDWACGSALDRLGFATAREIQAFWNAVPLEAVTAWTGSALTRGEIVAIHVEGADGRLRRALARPEVLDEAAALAEPTRRLRVLSPFDPMLRDRARAEALFGFRYRIEVFVPEAKRRWGYYVFPLLEGDRLVGRLDAKAVRSQSELQVRAFWPEAGLRLTKARRMKLEAELSRLARFAGCAEVRYLPGWEREHIVP